MHSVRWNAALAASVLTAASLGCNKTTQTGQASLFVSVSPKSIPNDGTMTQVSVLAQDAQGNPGTGAVSLSSAAGQLGGSGTTAMVTLDSTGKGQTTFSCNIALDTKCVAGSVQITGTWSSTTSTASVSVTQKTAGTDAGNQNDAGSGTDGGADAGNAFEQLAWISTDCNGAACTIMGIQGSGFNEVSQVAFKLVDASNNPLGGVTVTFSLANPPSGTNVSASAVTNSTGIAIATLSAGRIIGATSVHAVVIPGQVEADSPTIGIRGAKPTNKGFDFYCSPVNLAAYVSNTPPAPYDITCTVKLVDRYLNTVGTGTTVNFKVEAGSITPSVATQAYMSGVGADNSGEGSGSVTFHTLGVYPPVDVTPLPGNPSQYPNPQVAEPFNGSMNPRDSLVSLLAYTQGEEFFNDDNANGTWDPGESFVDQGEPLVDSNDNGIWDPGEVFLDLNGNGIWDGPNGVWDSNTTVWTETRVIYSGRPCTSAGYIKAAPAAFAGTCASGNALAVGADTSVALFFPDCFFNRVQSAQTSLSIITQPTAGSVTIANSTILDGYGFGVERRLLDSAETGDCTASTPICHWKYLFYNWDEGFLSDALITGATASTPACSDTSFTAQAQVLSVNYDLAVPGGVNH